MPKVIIQHQTALGPQEAFEKVKGVLSDDKDLKKLDPHYKCTFDDPTLSGTANGKMFKAAMQVKGASMGCEVEITVDLPLALALAKGVVQKTLKKKLEDSLT